MLNAEALLELYIDDEELEKLIFDLKKNIIQNLFDPSKFLLDLRHNNFEHEQLEETPMDTAENIEIHAEKFKELMEKRKEIFEEYRTNMIKGFEVVVDDEKKFRVYARDYIKKISAD